MVLSFRLHLKNIKRQRVKKVKIKYSFESLKNIVVIQKNIVVT